MKRITSYSTDESARERTSVSTLCKQLSSKFREINIRQFPSTRFGANENVNENEQSEKEGRERQSEKERERNRKCHWTHLWFGSGICLWCSLYLLFWLCSVWCSFFHIVGGVVHYFITVFFSLFRFMLLHVSKAGWINKKMLEKNLFIYTVEKKARGKGDKLFNGAQNRCVLTHGSTQSEQSFTVCAAWALNRDLDFVNTLVHTHTHRTIDWFDCPLLVLLLGRIHPD